MDFGASEKSKDDTYEFSLNGKRNICVLQPLHIKDEKQSSKYDDLNEYYNLEDIDGILSHQSDDLIPIEYDGIPMLQSDEDKRKSVEGYILENK